MNIAIGQNFCARTDGCEDNQVSIFCIDLLTRAYRCVDHFGLLRNGDDFGFWYLGFVLLSVALPARAEGPMSLEKLQEIVRAVDPDAQITPSAMMLTVEDIPVIIVHDADRNRMRAMTAIRSAATLSPEELMRMMQANFDSALDARYAVAQGRLWSVFIHPLAELQKDEFLEGLGQVVNLALTYGSTYTSGALTFGGGDSNQLHRELIERLLKKGEDI